MALLENDREELRGHSALVARICRRVCERLGLAPEEAGNIVEDLAEEKTERELRITRETGKIADVGFKAFLKYARVGIREYELLAEMARIRHEGIARSHDERSRTVRAVILMALGFCHEFFLLVQEN